MSDILRFGAKFVFPHSVLSGGGGHFKQTDIAARLFQLNPRLVEKFRERRLTDLGKSEFGKNYNHAQNIRSRRSQNGRSNKTHYAVAKVLIKGHFEGERPIPFFTCSRT